MQKSELLEMRDNAEITNERKERNAAQKGDGLLTGKGRIWYTVIDAQAYLLQKRERIIWYTVVDAQGISAAEKRKIF